MTTSYQPDAIEAEAQKYWHDKKSFQVVEDSDSEKYYCLSMLPYPSGNLHMGHVRNYTIGDISSRYHRFLGKNVLQPMGFDAFGLPAENAALQHKTAPSKWTDKNIEQMKAQFLRLGFGYDWSRCFATCKPDYYRWEQWLFCRLLERDLAYRKEMAVNWDPVDQTVLANEQVVDGKGWRSGAPIERKDIAQWFLKITDYADQLIDDIDQLTDWPENVKTMQRNWIGRSYGAQISFRVDQRPEQLDVFTTRADTLMGVSFMAIAPTHTLALEAAENNPKITAFIEAYQHTKVSEAELATQEKKGIATPFFAIHPITEQKIPIWIANFVIADYGTGALMGVPAHDGRDHTFALAHQLPIMPVIESPEAHDYQQSEFTGYGNLINSGPFDGMSSEEGKRAITDHLESTGVGKTTKQFRLRDWGVSRQRYWGCPIPVLYDQANNPIPVPDQDLPVILPTDINLTSPQSPLPNRDDFVRVSHPETGESCRRETDTFDTFVESSWYYLRYCCPDQHEKMLDDRANYWAPVDLYIGGIEHATMHLLYARFIHKVLRDMGLVVGDEPFKHLLTQGMVLKDGTKMSKSKGNTVDPNAMIQKYGADTLRFFVTFAAPPEQSFEWSDGGVEGSYRFLKKLWQFAHNHADSIKSCHDLTPDWEALPSGHQSIRLTLHQLIQQAQLDMDRLQLNTVASACMKMLNALTQLDNLNDNVAVAHEGLHHLLIILNPICPHITHHLWQSLGYGTDILEASWPQADPTVLNAKLDVSMVVQINGKKRAEITMAPDLDQAAIMTKVTTHADLEKYLQDHKIIKTIVVPNKLINLVVKQ